MQKTGNRVAIAAAKVKTSGRLAVANVKIKRLTVRGCGRKGQNEWPACGCERDVKTGDGVAAAA